MQVSWDRLIIRGVGSEPFGVHPGACERCPGTAAEGMCLDSAISHWYQLLPQETQMKKVYGSFISFILKYIFNVSTNVYINLTDL